MAWPARTPRARASALAAATTPEPSGSAADDHGTAAQRRIEAPLDRDEERVEVDVEDAARPLSRLHNSSVGGRGARGRSARAAAADQCSGPLGGPNDSW